MMRSLLVRGMLVGLVAAALATVIAWIFGEPQVGHAIAFEEAHSAAHEAGGHEPEVVSRTVQQTVGLITALGVYGVAFGGLFAIVFALAYGRIGRFGARATSVLVALGGFVAVYLVPFLKYPPTPPATGNPDTIGSRTALYFSLMLFGVLAIVAAVHVGRRLLPRLGGWNASLAGGAAFVAVVGVVYLVTPVVNEVPDGFDATVLWRFRIASLGIQLVLWGTFGLLFGALTERAFNRGRTARASVNA
ncbi:CbtA family protein [Actinomadura sp. HBU206391]|uniref:CbtA family protein n=1 Tax=Actinomadura sp. HBU206391 TaxID=2731692 RepID=UPI00164FEDEE|nr:CbtA family protein [Actinomadura sp. HBU206391]MBC6459015.1 CbtA family protein [Actinomadura sp. HBU206391]